MIHSIVWSGTPERIQVFSFEQCVVLVSGVLVQLVPGLVRDPAGAEGAGELEPGFKVHFFVMLLGLVLVAHHLITQFAFVAERKAIEKLAVKVHERRKCSSIHQTCALRPRPAA